MSLSIQNLSISDVLLSTCNRIHNALEEKVSLVAMRKLKEIVKACIFILPPTGFLALITNKTPSVVLEKYIYLTIPASLVVVPLLFILWARICCNFSNKLYLHEVEMMRNSSEAQKNILLIQHSSETNLSQRSLSLPQWWVKKLIPEADENVELAYNRVWIEDLKRTQKINFRRIVVYSEEQLERELDSIGDKTVDILMINAHGSQLGFTLHPSQRINLATSVLKFRRFADKLAQKVSRSCQIVLQSCNTGVKEVNIAKSLSIKIPGSTVYAPTCVITTEEGFRLNGEGKPYLMKGNQFSKVYKNDSLLERIISCFLDLYRFVKFPQH